MASEDSEKRAADCAPCADSNSILKDQIEKLDNMELLDGKEGPDDETDDNKSIDYELQFSSNPVPGFHTISALATARKHGGLITYF